MKKWLSVLLALCLMMSCCAVAVADVDDVEFDPMMTNLMDKTSSEWLSSSTNRALLATLMMGDLLSNDVDEIFEFSLENGAYIGRTSTSIIICYANDEGILTVFYTPVLDSCTYSYMEFSMGYLFVEDVLEQNCLATYQVTALELIEMMELVMEALKS